MRDWGSPKTHANGIEGGAGHLGDVLKVDDENIGCKELSEVREDIKNCFADLSCYLMPHPGLAVAEGDGDEGVFEGQLSAIRASFREQLKDLVPRVVGVSAAASTRASSAALRTGRCAGGSAVSPSSPSPSPQKCLTHIF